MMFVALFAGSMNAQDTNAKRTVLFTLGANEEIHCREYFVLQQVNQNRFACIIKNTVKDTYTFVFNGKRIVTGDRRVSFDNIHIDVHYLNVHEENGYAVEYSLQDMGYANIKGKVYGPFDESENDGKDFLVFAKDSEGNTDCNRFYYRKTEDGNHNYYIHYNGTKEGPFDGICFPEKISAYADCEYLYLLAGKWYAHYSNSANKMTSLIRCYVDIKNGKWYVNINGRDSKGYDDVRDLHFTESGKYFYSYYENGKKYVNINGAESSGYEFVNYLRFTENGKYAYKYQENGKWYVNINGAKSRGYESATSLYFTESGKYAYPYKENGKWYVNINGKESRGYDNVSWGLYFTESEKYAYKYKENGKWYVNINGKESRGYDDVHWSFHFTESGKYAYSYKENGKWHVNVNGRDSVSYDESCELIMLTEDDNGNIYYPNNEGKICKNDNGQETEYLSRMLWGFTRPAFFGNRNYDVGRPPALEIYSIGREHTLYSSYEYEYIVVDGKRFGNAPALYAWYDKAKNAFIWNAVEGKELVVYEYKLD
jgi:hypothetical protein